MTPIAPKALKKNTILISKEIAESIQDALNTQKALDEIADMIFDQLTPAKKISNRINEIKLTREFNPNRLISKGQTLLVHGAAARSVECLEMLQSFGADVTIQDNDGLCAMHKAQSSEVMRWLKHQGVSIDAKNNVGDTPLHKICFGRDMNASDVVMALIDQGADFNARNAKKESLLHCLAQGFADYNNREKITSFLVSRGADVNAKEIRGRTPLHFLAYQRSPLLILSMVRLGADIDSSDKWKLRPIHIAVNAEDEPSIFTLNALGASMQGTLASKNKIDDFLHESRFISAIRTNDPEILMAHLKLFPDPSPEDIKTSKAIINKNNVLNQRNLSAVVNSHLAARAIEELLETKKIRPVLPR